MSVKEIIQKRKSIRNYTNEKIDKKVILDILDCGRLAPSAKNRQPWRFVVVSEENKNNIAKIMEEKNY